MSVKQARKSMTTIITLIEGWRRRYKETMDKPDEAREALRGLKKIRVKLDAKKD